MRLHRSLPLLQRLATTGLSQGSTHSAGCLASAHFTTYNKWSGQERPGILTNVAIAGAFATAAVSFATVCQAEDYREFRDLDKAERQEADGIAPPGTSHPLDTTAITNEHTAAMTLAKKRAMDYYQAGQMRKAEKKFLEALEEAKLGFGPGDAHIASCQNNLAEFYKNTGRYKEAEGYYKQAIQLLDELFSGNHWLYVSALHNLALMYLEQGQLQQAKELLEKVLQLRAKMFGTGHLTYADTMFTIGKLLSKMGNQDKQAEGMMKHGIQVIENSGSTEGTPILMWYLDLAELQAGPLKHNAAATASLRRAMELLTEQQGEGVAKASNVAERLSDTLAAAGVVSEAFDILKDCATARMELFGRHLVVAKTFTKCARLALKQGGAEGLQLAEHYSSSAAAIASEARTELHKKPLLSFLRKENPEKLEERAQAGLQLAAAMRELSNVRQQQQQRAAAAQALQQACSCLEDTIAATKHELPKLADNEAVLDKVLGLYIDLQVLLMEVLESQAGLLQQLGRGDEAVQCSRRADAVAAELTGSKE